MLEIEIFLELTMEEKTTGVGLLKRTRVDHIMMTTVTLKLTEKWMGNWINLDYWKNLKARTLVVHC